MKRIFPLKQALFVSVAFLVFCSAQAAKTIKIGNTMPYSGPAATFGAIGKAQEAYFKYVNEKNELPGKIEFITLDNAYSPPKNLEQTRRLVEQDKVDIVFGMVGTASTIAVWDYLNEKQVPLFFHFSGDQRMDDAKGHPGIFAGAVLENRIETKLHVEHILKVVKDPKIGVLFLNDELGQELLRTFKTNLGDKNKGLIVAEEGVQGTDPTADAQLNRIKAAGANVIVIYTTPKFSAQAIKKITSMDWKPLRLVSTVAVQIGTTLKTAGWDNASGILSVRAIKDPGDQHLANDPDVKLFKTWAAKELPNTEPIYPHALGFVSAALMEAALKNAGSDWSRDNLIKAVVGFKNLRVPMMMDGVSVSGDKDSRTLQRNGTLMRFDGKGWVAIN